LQKEYEEIIRINKNYLKLKNDTRVKYALADAYAKSGKERKAYIILNELENEYGVSEQIILKKVDILKRRKKTDKAEKELKKLIEVVPESPEYNIIMAEFYKEIGSTEKSLIYFERAYGLDSTNVFAISNLADHYTEHGPMEVGLYYLNRAFTMDEVSLEKKISSILYFMGDEKTLNKYAKEYEKTIETLLEKYPDSYDVKTVAYDFYNKTQNYRISYEIIKELLEENDKNFILWQQAIYNASLLNEYNDIIEMGEKALKIFPNKKELQLFMGIAYYQKEEYNHAYKYLNGGYEEGIAMQLQIQYLTFLGESAFKLGKTEEAFYYFEELLLLDPENYIVMNNYSYYLALNNRKLERAAELSKKTIEKFPDNDTYLDTYAWILFKQEKFNSAREVIDTIDKENINDPDVYYHLGWIYCKTGDNEKAIEFFRQALQLGYESTEDIQKGIEQCKN
jgi:predicted Zn-dependent protease